MVVAAGVSLRSWNGRWLLDFGMDGNILETRPNTNRPACAGNLDGGIVRVHLSGDKLARARSTGVLLTLVGAVSTFCKRC